jgi:rhamnogalacturonyl hydrolase YesR
MTNRGAFHRVLLLSCLAALPTACGASPDAGGDTTDSSAVAPGRDAASPSMDSSAVGPAPDGAQATTDGMATPPPDDAGTDATAPTDGASGVSDPSVLAMMRKVADWQLLQGGISGIDWIRGAMWTGIFATYQVTQDVKYRDAAVTWGQTNNFGLSGGVTTNADNQCAAQTYFDLYLIDSMTMDLVTGAKPSFDAMVTSGNTGWTWADSLFMSPPGVTRLGAIENDPKYFQLLHANWWKAYASMFSAADGLMYRNPPAGGPAAGDGIFWGRGDGWVIAGLARVLEYLPQSDVRRPDYETMLKAMAAGLKPWQGSDGLWRSDITHPAAFPNPETSGTGFMTFAIAWGVNHSILDRTTYLPIAKAGWQGLVSCVDANGKLGYVQGVGASPGPATATSNAPYGVGAFLLAGSEVAKLQ